MPRRSLACFVAVAAMSSCAPLGRRSPLVQDTLVGAWLAEVTLTDCASGQPTGAPPFRALVVFHAGGTLSEASGPSSRRTPSFGAWSRSGQNEYFAVSQLLTYDANGSPSGAQEIRRTIRLSPDGKRFSAETRTVGTDASGTVVLRGCARGDATRVE